MDHKKIHLIKKMKKYLDLNIIASNKFANVLEDCLSKELNVADDYQAQYIILCDAENELIKAHKDYINKCHRVSSLFIAERSSYNIFDM